jgi:hypothetical protein
MGSGRMQVAGASRTLAWQIDRVAIGQKAVQGRGKPLGLVSMRLDARGAMQEAVITYPAYFEAGAANLDRGGYDHLFVTMLTGGLSNGWAILPGRPIAMGQPAFDANGYIDGLFSALAPGAMLTRRLPMGTVVGTVDFQGKQALVARVAGQAAVRMPSTSATVTVNVDGFALLDVGTALPIYTDAAVTLATPGTGSVDAILRTYVQY